MQNNWDEHWESLTRKGSILGKICELFRKTIIANLITNSFKKYFSEEGIFVDAGCGTSQISIKINKNKKTLIGVDLSYEILHEAKKYSDFTINSDIFKLPFKNESVDGIWNAGVMEHFKLEEIDLILKEFNRILKKDGVCLLLWPAVYGPVNIFTRTLEFVFNRILRMKYKFFPEEINLLKSKEWVKRIILKRFRCCKVYWPLKNGLIYHLVVCYK